MVWAHASSLYINQTMCTRCVVIWADILQKYARYRLSVWPVYTNFNVTLLLSMGNPAAITVRRYSLRRWVFFSPDLFIKGFGVSIMESWGVPAFRCMVPHIKYCRVQICCFICRHSKKIKNKWLVTRTKQPLPPSPNTKYRTRPSLNGTDPRVTQEHRN